MEAFLLLSIIFVGAFFMVAMLAMFVMLVANTYGKPEPGPVHRTVDLPHSR